LIQNQHLKLAFAGSLTDWNLAAYELTEIRRSFDTAEEYYPEYKSVPLARLVDEISRPALTEFERDIG